jgi:MFS family permease
MTLSIAGVYMGPLADSLGINHGDVALWIAVSGPFSVISSPLWGTLIQTKNINVVTSIAVLCLIAGVLIFAFAGALWQLLVAGALIGFGLPMCSSIAVPTLITNWFAENIRGRMLGIATAFSGVGVFIWAPMFTLLINASGMRVAYLINAAIMAALLLPFTLFVFKLKPQKLGLLPYGYDPNADNSEVKKTLQSGMKLKTAVKYTTFWLLFCGVALCSLGMGFNSNQPNLANAVLVPGQMDASGAALFGASMISTAAVGNIIGKIIFGFLTDKIGLRLTLFVFFILFILSFVLWLIFSSPVMLLVAAFLLGTHNALPSVGLPLLARTLFGAKNFSKIWGYTHMGASLIGGFGTSVVAYTYQFSGTHTTSLFLGMALVTAIAVFVLSAAAKIGKLPFDDFDDGETAGGPAGGPSPEKA